MSNVPPFSSAPILHDYFLSALERLSANSGGGGGRVRGNEIRAKACFSHALCFLLYISQFGSLARVLPNLRLKLVAEVNFCCATSCKEESVG